MRLRVKMLLSVLCIASLLSIGTIAYHFLEHWTWIQSLYFSVITITTIGYGDMHPTTDISRLFTIFYALGGVSITLVVLGVTAKAYLDREEKRLEVLIKNLSGEKPAEQKQQKK